MIGTRIVLNAGEQVICERVARARYESNRAKGVTNAKRGNQSDYTTDLEGIASEMAFCKLFNVYPDLSIEPRSSQDGQDQGDATIDGLTIDVKSTKYKAGRLIAVPWKEPNVALFALMIGTFPEYEFKGFMKSDDLLREERLATLGYGPTFVANQCELKEFDCVK